MLDDHCKTSIGPSVAAALAEDVGAGDVSAPLIDDDEILGAKIVAREAVVIAGECWVDEVFRQLDDRVIVDWYVGDGQSAEADDIICKLVGPARALLAGERTALNFLQALSATATATARYVAAVAGSNATIVATRHTLPGLRLAQQHAVRCGGGNSHGSGLFDTLRLQPAHASAAGGITRMLQRAAELDGDVPQEIAVRSQEELIAALDAGASRVILLDFSAEQLTQAVASNEAYGYLAAELVAAGDLSLEEARACALAGIDCIATTALTSAISTAALSMVYRID